LCDERLVRADGLPDGDAGVVDRIVEAEALEGVVHPRAAFLRELEALAPFFVEVLLHARERVALHLPEARLVEECGEVPQVV
jgi:hypothetical protein